AWYHSDLRISKQHGRWPWLPNSELSEGDSAVDGLFVMDNYTDREAPLEIRISDPSSHQPSPLVAMDGGNRDWLL
ncbi:hypothetical protein PIB30_082050, partial [Stylosanthes scabra]|nr:hypothetical protein [Stylosanthes scabra]